MNFLDYLYTRESAAMAIGMTHEGRMFGVPAWLTTDGDVCYGCPKVPVLQLWCILIDSLMGAATYFLPEDAVLEVPIHIGRPLGALT
ncbi:MAG: hypothetical protein G3W64_19830 [Xanthomonas euvesicatoria]|uniref:Uncharacterized protein n=2 Tax=root TaxID=1 RepID=A0A3G1GLC7_9CAUD|nr:hypothetical protein KEM13_gp18 [Xanthomonas phage KPhi1]APQ41897.1 hypothetical protein K1pha_18 [Xanthomonas phage KPhi1]NEK74991.1 hypothetical protein [Xanthomonas euvesicatoria]NEL31760.1 hypothetical protein [Xanthomonas euvesicatoria]UUW40398.1 hypothetical protein [Xanthomonas phage BsXeu269p/3]